MVCRNCNNTQSDNSKFCSNCGAPLKKSKSNLISWIIGILLILGSFGAFGKIVFPFSILTFLVLLCSGLLILPPVIAATPQITTKFRIIGIISFLVIVVSISPEKEEVKSVDKQTQQTKEKTPSATLKFTPIQTPETTIEPIVKPLEKPTPISTPEKQSAKTFGVTFDEFKSNYRSAAKKFDSSQRLGELKKESDDPSGTVYVNKHISLMLTFEGDKIASLIFIGAGDGTQQSGLDILTGMAITIRALNPSINEKQAGELLSRSGISNNPIGGETTYEGVKYQLSQTKELGTWLQISLQD